MDTLKYIESACSKDKARFNLGAVYRDKNHLVATNGHILHYANGLADVEPHFLNGQEGTFPDWQQVLPKETKEVASLDNAAYLHLQLLPFLKICASVNKRSAPVKFENENGKLKLNFKREFYEFTFNSEIEVLSDFEPIAFCANLLLISLRPLEKDKKMVSTLNMESVNSPMVIKHNSYDFHANAVIMPIRFN
jgi:DNA polymerase III sliding clamp (beta) subunit (PCNA family)